MIKIYTSEWAKFTIATDEEELRAWIPFWTEVP